MLVEALLILAREKDAGIDDERFVVNDALQQELDSPARCSSVGRSSWSWKSRRDSRWKGRRRRFRVLCWQLIRNACQQTEQGRVVVTRDARRGQREQPVPTAVLPDDARRAAAAGRRPAWL